MKDHYFLFLNGETQNFPKITDFLPNTITISPINLNKFQIFFADFHIYLRIFTGKKHPHMKLQRSVEVWIRAFGLLVDQINSHVM